LQERKLRLDAVRLIDLKERALPLAKDRFKEDTMRHRARAPMLTTLGVLLWLLPAASAQAAAPVCPNASLTTTPGERIALASNPCVDPDGDNYTLAIGTGPSHGTVSPENGINYYIPSPGYHGTDLFTYTATDSTMAVSDVATVSILVDTAPECDDRSATVESGRQLTLTDIPCQDGDGDTLDIFVSDPQHGTLDIAGDGSSVTYTPAPGYVGPDAITYQAQDVLGLSSTTRTLTITVTTPPPPPQPPAPPAPAVAASTDRTAPNFTLGTLSTKLKSVLTKGLRLTITSSERGTTTVTVTIDRSTARKLKLKRNAKAPVKVASLRTTVASGHTNLVVKLTAKARKALSKARTVKLRITITVTDAGGNSTTHTRTITLKR
jgi:hypothetical protein